jgi:hypothetical protein
MAIVGVRGPVYNTNDKYGKYIPMVSGIETSQFWLDRVAERHCMECPEWTKQSGIDTRYSYIPTNYSGVQWSQLAGYPLHDRDFWHIFQENTALVNSGLMFDGGPFVNYANKPIWSGNNYNVRFNYSKSGYTEHEAEFLKYGKPNKEDFNQYIPKTHIESVGFAHYGSVIHDRLVRDFTDFSSYWIYTSGSRDLSPVMSQNVNVTQQCFWYNFSVNNGTTTVDTNNGIWVISDFGFITPDCSEWSFAEEFAPGKIIGYKVVGCKPASVNTQYKMIGERRHKISQCDVNYHAAYSGLFYGSGNNVVVDSYSLGPISEKQNNFSFAPIITYSGDRTEYEVCFGASPPYVAFSYPKTLEIRGLLQRIIQVYVWPLKTNGKFHAFRSTFGLDSNGEVRYSGHFSASTTKVGLNDGEDTVFTSRAVTTAPGSAYKVAFGDHCCGTFHPALQNIAGFPKSTYDNITRQHGKQRLWYTFCDADEIAGYWQSGIYKSFLDIEFPSGTIDIRKYENDCDLITSCASKYDCVILPVKKSISYHWFNSDFRIDNLPPTFFQTSASGMFSCYNPNKEFLVLYDEKEFLIPPIDFFQPETIVRGGAARFPEYYHESRVKYQINHFELATCDSLIRQSQAGSCECIDLADGYSVQDITNYESPWSSWFTYNMDRFYPVEIVDWWNSGTCGGGQLYGYFDPNNINSRHFQMPYLWDNLHKPHENIPSRNQIYANFVEHHFSGVNSYVPIVGDSILTLEPDYELYSGTLRTKGYEHYAIGDYL